MIDIEKLINLKKKNDIVLKSLYIFIIISCFVICINLLVYIEVFPFIVLILLALLIILYLYAKKINIELKKMHNEVIRNE